MSSKEYLISWVARQFSELVDRIWFRISWRDDVGASLFIYGGAKDCDDTFEIKQELDRYEVCVISGEMFVEVEFGTLKEACTFLGYYYPAKTEIDNEKEAESTCNSSSSSKAS